MDRGLRRHHLNVHSKKPHWHIHTRQIDGAQVGLQSGMSR
jgi:hypothetical protein